MKLINGKNLIVAAQQSNVSLIISGHVHEKMYQKLSPGISLVAGTCSAVDTVEDHETHILTLDVEDRRIVKLTRDNLKYEGGMFVKDTTEEFVSELVE